MSSTTRDVRLVGGPIHGRVVTLPALDRVSYEITLGTGKTGRYVPIRADLGEELYWAGSDIDPQMPEVISQTFTTMVGESTKRLSTILALLKTIHERGLIHGPLITRTDPETKKVTLGFFVVRGDLA